MIPTNLQFRRYQLKPQVTNMSMAKVWARQGLLNVTETTTMTGSSYVQLQKKRIDSRAVFCFVLPVT